MCEFSLYKKLQNYDNLIKYYINKIESLHCNKKKSGRPIKCDNYKIIQYILYFLLSGITWDALDGLLKLSNQLFTADMIRKRFYNWKNKGIFNNVKKELTSKYLKNVTDNEFLLDSTDVINNMGIKSETGYGQKLHNKRAVKNSIICDKNKIPLAYDPSPANLSDCQRIINTVADLPIEVLNEYSYKNPMPISADKGYHQKIEDRQFLRKYFNVVINVPNKKKMKRKISKKNKDLLTRRYKIENLNSTLKRTFKHFNKINDRKYDILYDHFYIYSTCLIVDYMNKNKIPL
jgi:hypothetical protein